MPDARETAAFTHQPPPSTGPLAMPVRQIMTPGVVCISQDTSVRQAQRALVAHGVHALLVISREGGRPLGWVTADGMLRWLVGQHPLSSVDEAITEPAVTIDPSANGEEALGLFAAENVSRLLVSSLPEAAPEGVVSALDFLAAAERSKRLQASLMRLSGSVGPGVGRP